MRPSLSWRRRDAGGFTYLGVMFIVVVLSMTASMASVVWSTVHQRHNEHELVFVGRQFQAAIERYQQRSKEAEARYPRRLEDLLRDDRAPSIERHLRRLYTDPMTGRAEWGLIRRPDGGIVGVHSLSERKPMPGSLRAAALNASDALTYSEWRFMAPSAVAPVAESPAAAPTTGSTKPP